VYQGESIAKLDVARDLPWLDQGYQQAIDIERFRWFSNDYLALDPDDANKIVDIRYSLMPNQIDALWSIHIDPAASPDQHAIYQTHRGEAGQLASRLWSMILGRDV
jgi:inner membrane protein